MIGYYQASEGGREGMAAAPMTQQEVRMQDIPEARRLLDLARVELESRRLALVAVATPGLFSGIGMHESNEATLARAIDDAIISLIGLEEDVANAAKILQAPQYASQIR